MQGGTWLWGVALLLLVGALAELFPARAASTDAILHLSWRSRPDGARREISEPVAAVFCAQVTDARRSLPGGYTMSITCEPR